MNRYGTLLGIGLCLSAAAHAGVSLDPDELRCIEASARFNALPPALLIAVRQQEGGRVGAWRHNADGSFDYGVMQINSLWLPVLAPEGYTAAALTYDSCASIAASAWIMAQALSTHGAWNRFDANPLAFWRAVGDYHSHTPQLNRSYAEQIWVRYQHQSGQRLP